MRKEMGEGRRGWKERGKKDTPLHKQPQQQGSNTHTVHHWISPRIDL